MTTCEIFGEDVDAIGAAMQHFKFEPPDEDGMMTVHAHAPIAELAPLFRALMRAEAQMLLSDADDYPDTEESRRTGGQRRNDALVEISQRLIDAVEAQN